MTSFPLGFGLYQHASDPGSAHRSLTDLKETVWSTAILDQLTDFFVILDSDGRVKYTSPSAFAVAGYSAVQLHGALFRALLHPDDRETFVSELRETVALISPFRMFYRFRKKDGSHVVLEAVGHAHVASATHIQSSTEQSPQCQAVFIAARPYPTVAESILDSFLEYKVENERLRKHFVEHIVLKSKLTDAHGKSLQRKEPQTDNRRPHIAELTSASASRQDSSIADSSTTELDAATFIPALRPEAVEFSVAGVLDGCLLRASRADILEMLIGLPDVAEEPGCDTKGRDGGLLLVKGDAGITMPLKEPRQRQRKRKQNKQGHTCTDCGKPDETDYQFCS